MTGYGDVAMAVMAMKAGAMDFIEKPFDNDHLLQQVRACLTQCGHQYNQEEGIGHL